MQQQEHEGDGGKDAHSNTSPSIPSVTVNLPGGTAPVRLGHLLDSLFQADDSDEMNKVAEKA